MLTARPFVRRYCGLHPSRLHRCGAPVQVRIRAQNPAIAEGARDRQLCATADAEMIIDDVPLVAIRTDPRIVAVPTGAHLTRG